MPTPLTTFTPEAPLPVFAAGHRGEDLLRRVLEQQDPNAFDALFKRYYVSLCQQAFSLTRCHQKAEEAVCDVFTKIWQRRHSLSVSTKAQHYLCRAVRNQAIDYLRREARERLCRDELQTGQGGMLPCPQQRLEAQEMRDQLDAAITSLPPQGQHIFRLSREEGLKYREIAELLGISVKTVETHMRRSLIHLRESFDSTTTNPA